MTISQPIEEQLVVPIPVSSIKTETGTYTYTSNAGLPKNQKSVTAETTILSCTLPGGYPTAQFGQKLNSINMILRISTADLTSYTATLYKRNNYLAINTPLASLVNLTATTISTTDTGGVTSTAMDRLWTITPVTTAYDSQTGAVNIYQYELVLSLVCAASTDLGIKGGHVIYTRV